MKRSRTWQPYDAQGRRNPPPFMPREPGPYETDEDGLLFDWDHPELHWEGRQLEGFLTLNEDACVRAVLSGVQFCDVEMATKLPGSIVGPILTAPWFLTVVYDRQALSFERGRAMLSQAFPDAVRYLYEVMSGEPERDPETGEVLRDDHGKAVVPPRSDRMRAAEMILKLGPQAEQQGVIARRVDALRRELQQSAAAELNPAEQTREIVQKYLPAVLAKREGGE